MFRKAYDLARQYTEPVISFHITVGGKCGAGLGALVIINTDGWIVTAAHMVRQAVDLATADRNARKWEDERDKINADRTVSAKERSRKFNALGRANKKSIRRAAIRWGHHASNLVDMKVLAGADLAVGRLEPFDPAWVSQYPTFKDPSKSFENGTSLCKLGFPFHEIAPTYDDAAGQFKIAPDMASIPFFPLDGIFTRRLNLPQPNPPLPYPLAFVETSSPGLRGQSGGPTVDIKGSIWAIQSSTRHIPLGFNPEIQDGGKSHKEHQFINVGMGVHVETVLGLFNEVGIKYNLSNY